MRGKSRRAASIRWAAAARPWLGTTCVSKPARCSSLSYETACTLSCAAPSCGSTISASSYLFLRSHCTCVASELPLRLVVVEHSDLAADKLRNPDYGIVGLC